MQTVKRLVAHPAARSVAGIASSDLLLVELSEPFQLGDLVNSACLADQEVDNEQLCITAGWSAENGGKQARRGHKHRC